MWNKIKRIISYIRNFSLTNYLNEKQKRKQEKIKQKIFDKEIKDYQLSIKKAIREVEDTRELFPQPKQIRRKKSDEELEVLIERYKNKGQNVEDFSRELKRKVNEGELSRLDFFTCMDRVDPVDIPLKNMMPLGTNYIYWAKYGDKTKIDKIEDERFRLIAMDIEKTKKDNNIKYEKEVVVIS